MSIIEYVWEEIPDGHNPSVGPVIIPGVAVADLRTRVLARLLPQLLVAITDKFPEIKELLKSRLIEVLPCPLEILDSRLAHVP